MALNISQIVRQLKTEVSKAIAIEGRTKGVRSEWRAFKPVVLWSQWVTTLIKASLM
jgi:hypothetical protein